MNVFSLQDNRVDVWLELAAVSGLCFKLISYSLGMVLKSINKSFENSENSLITGS